MSPTATKRRRRVRCSTCLSPLAKGACPKHGPRNADGSSLRPSKNKGRTFPAEPLTREEVAALLKACSHRSPTGIRNAAIVTTLWRSGIRCAELIALRPKDVNRSGGHLQVLHGKGDKQRSPFIDPSAIARIDLWLNVRRDLGISGHRPLFCTLSGQPLDDSYVRKLLRRLGGKAGIPRRVHPHSLRHTLAYEWMMQGVPIGTISEQLGHASIATTSIYLAHIAPKDLVAAGRALPEWDVDEDDEA